MVLQLKKNVAVFSAFKANHYAAAMRSLLLDEDGKKRSFNDFRKEAQKIDPKYNQLWLEAEYNMAIRQSRSAKQWQKFEAQKELYPNLEYMPSRSATPSDAHRKLWGTIKPIDDEFWNTAMPPSRWNCKCWVKQTEDKPTSKEVDAPEPLPGIAGNSGKSGMIFTATHAFISKLSKMEKEEVRKELNQLRESNNETIILKVGDGTVVIPINAHESDFKNNVLYASEVVKKYGGEFFINSHSEKLKVKNPEFKYRNTIGDLTTIEGENPKKYVRNTFDKLKKGNQLGEFRKAFLSMDFQGKLNESNYFETLKFLNGKMGNNQKVQFVILKNKKKIVILNNNTTFNEKLQLLKKELL